MSGIIEKLTFYFQYPFVWYALIVGILIVLFPVRRYFSA